MSSILQGNVPTAVVRFFWAVLSAVAIAVGASLIHVPIINLLVGFPLLGTGVAGLASGLFTARAVAIEPSGQHRSVTTGALLLLLGVALVAMGALAAGFGMADYLYSTERSLPHGLTSPRVFLLFVLTTAGPLLIAAGLTVRRVSGAAAWLWMIAAWSAQPLAGVVAFLIAKAGAPLSA